MTMSNHKEACKKEARAMKKSRPDDCHNKRLDAAAEKQGFDHYTHLDKAYKAIGPDKYPSDIELVMAGCTVPSPYQMLTKSITTS